MTDLERGFYQGFACACAVTLRNYGEDTIVKETFMCNFMSVAKMKEAGVDDFDIELLTPIVEEIERKLKELTKTAPPDAKHLLPAVPSLVKARNCNGCWAYQTYGWKQGLCTLGFDVEQLGNNCTEGSYGGDYWCFYCKPKEPCMKPKTGKQYAAAMSARHGT